MYRRLFKRLLDLAVSITVFLVFMPLFIVIIILLSIANRGKPFYFQLRPGKNERIFRLIKFKTMNDLKDATGELLPDHIRTTRIGRIIRNSSLDELPQLFNVIAGDMSLVGPRPLLSEYLQHYNAEQRKRHLVRPGITGWAQVNGRNTITWQKKFEYDVWYIDNLSFSLDIKIFMLTLLKVVKAKDINSSESVTMTRFTGN